MFPVEAPSSAHVKRAGPLRFGIVGVGTLTLRGILPHLCANDVRERVVVTALCDPVVDRAQEAADRYGIGKVYASIEDLVNDDTIDAVTIVSPIGLHATQGRIVLSAGKHVHLNKTMSTTVEEATELIEVADRAGCRIVASPGEVLRPQLTKVRQLISEGAIGRLSWAICGSSFGSYHENEAERFSASRTLIDPGWYFKRPGGGPLYDTTVYALHGLTSVLGPAGRVTAMSGITVPAHEFAGREIDTEVDDNTLILLDFGDSVFAAVHGTAAGGVVDDFGAAHYFGTKGEIRGLLLNGEPFQFAHRELTTDFPTWDWDAQMRVLPHVAGPHWQIPESHVFEDIMQLTDLVLDDKPTPVTADHARHVIDIIESAYRSAESRTTQELNTSFDWPPDLPGSEASA